jgi:hypothetical protein
MENPEEREANPDAPSTPPPSSNGSAGLSQDDAPVLKTLAPLLRKLEASLRIWLNKTHQYPLAAGNRATLNDLAADLRRQADALDADRPLLVIMLMGGTGVGKSTLLNALAGGAIAQASFARPTTRDPVVYFHISVKPEQLDPVLHHCRLSQHDRPALEQKIIVDTPDLDSNDLANREKLFALLPVADIVLYVGSQEKYHDKLGWELFLQQRQRRAFAFVLNKWDRCVHSGAAGLRPDEDLLQDLKEEGFNNPLLFRTNAQYWVDKHAGTVTQGNEPRPCEVLETSEAGSHAAPVAQVAQVAPPLPPPPEGEQFAELTHWLEMGLSRLEIEAIKARGVSQLLSHLDRTLRSACPPDLSAVADRTRTTWGRILGEEAAANAAILVNTLEPYQREIEHHFALQRQCQFHGVMGGYLRLFNRMKYAGSTLRDKIPFMPRSAAKVDAPAVWDLSSFTQACSQAASERHLDSRGKALTNRLLVEADQQGFPLSLLGEPTEVRARLDWRQRHADALGDVLGQIQREWANPTGLRALVQAVIVFLGDWLPLLTIGAVFAFLLWGYFVLEPPRRFEFWDLFLVAFALLMVLVLLHILITLFMPLRWAAIRNEFHRLIERRLHADLEEGYVNVPLEVAKVLNEERKQVHVLVDEVHEVIAWLDKREQAASIAAMYGR